MELHTSDRSLFRRCRRKWDWSSINRQNLIPIDEVSSIPLWYGTGFHFALEDFHGLNVFGDPVTAFRAYVDATQGSMNQDDMQLTIELAEGMLTYYVKFWLPQRDDFSTFVVDGRPQVEVNWKVPYPSREHPYGGRFDRVVIDAFGRLWIEDWKTAARIDTSKLDIDAQISAYAWAGSLIYGRQIEGVIWTQFLKAVPTLPNELKNGEFSQDARQKTTHGIYRSALLQKFGEVPDKYVPFLNDLAARETPEGDTFIRRDLVYRTWQQRASEELKIYDEYQDMLKPLIYPNPTRDCTWDCAFKEACIAVDCGYDDEYILRENFAVRPPESSDWRSRVRYPNGVDSSTLKRPVTIDLTHRADRAI